MSDYFNNDNNISYIGDVPVNMNYPKPDLTYLKDMADGDENFIREIIEIFLRNGPESLVLMREYALSGNHEKLKFVAHKLLPELTFVGILSAIPDVEKISLESDQMNDLPIALNRVILIINSGIDELRKMI